MKSFFIKVRKWIVQLIIRLFIFCKRLILGIPGKLKQSIFGFGAWGKRQLDKRINTKQKQYLHSIIFESETVQARRFDTILIWVIVASIIVVILETVVEFQRVYWWWFFALEWVFTFVFTVEYILRLYCSRHPLRYATSFFGLVDLLSIIPAYLGIFFIAAGKLTVLRALRLLRVFRIFKMGHFVSEGEVIVSALRASRTKIYVFVSFVVLLAIIIGSLMHIVEGGANANLNNIPKGIYWAIVTLTTVGYGDVTAITPFGKFLSTIVMIMGYGVIAVPTGIVTAEISGRVLDMKSLKFTTCPNCQQAEHHSGAKYCHNCGNLITE